MRLRIDLESLLATRRPKVGATLFIAIDGHGGSGKSTLARLLAPKLDAEVIETDDFASFDNSPDWWPRVIGHVFEPIRRGARTLDYPRAARWKGHNPEPVIGQPVTDVMILEGVSALRREFRDYISVGLFVDTPKEICLSRGMRRDAGRAAGEELRVF